MCLKNLREAVKEEKDTPEESLNLVQKDGRHLKNGQTINISRRHQKLDLTFTTKS